MQQPKYKSLAVDTLFKMGIRISVVVCVVTGFAYLHLQHTLQEEAQKQLQAYSEQRIARERLPFELAAQTGERFRKDYLRRLAQPIPPDLDERFARIAHSWGDGTLRNAKAGFDPDTMVGLFVGPQQHIDATFKRRALLAVDMIDVLGPEMTSRFPDFYLTMPDNVMVIYWPGVAWTSDMAPDFDMRKEPYLAVASREKNPKGEQRWTPIYYDAVGKVWMMSFATPIYVGGEHIASVEQDILLGDFLKRTASQSLAGASNVILRKDGTLIFAQGYDARIVKANGALSVRDTRNPKLAAIMAASSVAGQHVRVVDQGDDLVSLGFIPGPNWYFATVYPKSLIASRALSAARVIFGLGVFSLIAELCILFFVLRRQVARPLKALTDATDAVAAGNLGVSIDLNRGDELGQLAASFNSMTQAVRTRDAQLAEHTAGLEATVAKRTEQLDGRNREMRTVMDHVEQGLVTLDLAGIMSDECSAALERWFGPASSGQPFASYIGLHDSNFAGNFTLGFNEVTDGFMPLEVTVDQLPRKISLGDRSIRVEYLPILREGELAQMLVVMSDNTAELARARAEAEQQELATIIEQVTRDKQGFVDFFEESSKIVRLLTVDPVGDPVVDARTLHTLKGNSGLVGLHAFAELCHKLEESTAEARFFSIADRSLLAHRWQSLASKVGALVGEARKHLVEIPRSKLADLATILRGGVSGPLPADLVEKWALDPVEARLARLGEYAVSLAKRCGKPKLEVGVSAAGLHVDGDAWAPIWATAVHLVRNAVDHGIEGPEVREIFNKPRGGRLTLGARLEGEEFIVSFADDGAGIDWEVVGERARTLGIPAKTPGDLERALFVDGLTTCDSVSETSGRGIGLSALKLEVERQGGRVYLSSARGIGTLWELRFPVMAMAPKRAHPRPSAVPPALDRLRAGS